MDGIYLNMNPERFSDIVRFVLLGVVAVPLYAAMVVFSPTLFVLAVAYKERHVPRVDVISPPPTKKGRFMWLRNRVIPGIFSTRA